MAPTPKIGANKPDAAVYGRSLTTGLGLNLLVTDVIAVAEFHRDVLGAEIVYWDEDFAIIRGYGAEWMLHRDRTYRNHPLIGVVRGAETRGAGVELRLYGADPDAAEARARAADGVVLDGAADKPHGQREVFIADPEGYVWALGVPIGED
jgi:catechol 2,3-dioxygenase-like lactoylglutathione lyase family enzyme